MILGMTTETFTFVHVVISLIGILAGAMVLAQMIAGRHLGSSNVIFLVTTIATSVTGFLFHSVTFGPPHVVGVISLMVLAVALIALCARNRVGSWRATYAVAAVIALYLNVFVAITQAFQKLPLLKLLAPTQSELPFVALQAVVLVVFIVLGFAAVRRFRPSSSTASEGGAR